MAHPVTPNAQPAATPREPRPRSRLAWLLWGVATLVPVLIAIAVVLRLGPSFRRALLIETRQNADTALLAIEETHADEAAFFAQRDSVTITVPRDMTVGELMILYSLGNTARDEIGRALGYRVTSATVLRRGQEIPMRLTHVVEWEKGR